MTEHPSLETIALWVVAPESEALDPAARNHLESGCARCSTLARNLARLEAEARRAHRLRAPERVLERARALAETVSRTEAELLVAELVQDTVSLAGVRAGESGDRLLLFRADDYDVDLRIRRRSGSRRCEIRGQVHGPEEISLEKMEVRLFRDQTVLGTTETDDLGEFRLPAVPCPPFRLELTRDRLWIRTPDVAR